MTVDPPSDDAVEQKRTPKKMSKDAWQVAVELERLSHGHELSRRLTRSQGLGLEPDIIAALLCYDELEAEIQFS